MSSASAVGGAGENFFDDEGVGGAANASSTANSHGTGNATSFASATGGVGNGAPFNVQAAGGFANASSAANSHGTGNATSFASATGGDNSINFITAGFGSDATATANASAGGGGTAVATVIAAGGKYSDSDGFIGTANATSNAETAKGALAQAKSTALGSSGQAQSTAKTLFAGVGVQSSAVAPTNSDTATTNAIAQGGAGQAFGNPGQTAYAFSTTLPDKAYATTLIDGASHVASALLGPHDAVIGTAILGANYAPDGAGESDTYSASSTFDFADRGDLKLGLIDNQENGFAGGIGFQSMEFTITADGVEILDATFSSLAVAESFFRDDVIDLGSGLGPDIDLTFGYTLVADGSGGFGFDFALGGANLQPVPEPSTWAMMLVGFGGLGLASYRSTVRHAGLRA
jgi:hypothetical protein